MELWIETHAERISARGKSSVRYINRLFEREGTSVMHHVWERRPRAATAA